MVASSNANHNLEPWLANSVATNHFTSNLNNLSFPKPYGGQEHIIVGNGQGLPITRIVNVELLNSHFLLKLGNVLRVPEIASNLAFVHKLCHDNNCWCYSDENKLSIQAFLTRKVLYQGKSERGVHPIYPLLSPHLKLPHKTSAFSTITQPNWKLWHSRLGHPH